eukprot:TRINITY_DN67692_c3_g1_i7.p1 TRINITY_DN67692_c3_g1~~TRINITY_DN67692_c3_g1_i7.p1  ORF type:complete len:566 (-),score=293.74 TRINITY_DN67692_c3_g1_i7:138-1763(-)
MRVVGGKRKSAAVGGGAQREKKRRGRKSKEPLRREREEAALAAALFGEKDDAGDDGFDLDSLVQRNHPQQQQHQQHRQQQQQLDDDGDDDDDDDGDHKAEDKQPKSRKPAWQDEDDEQVVVNLSSVNRRRKLRSSEAEVAVSGAEYARRLRRTFEDMSAADPSAAWAQLPGSAKSNDGKHSGDDNNDEDDADAALLGSNMSLLNKQSNLLAPTTIDMTRMKDGNAEDPTAAVVQSVRFHPNGQLLMAAGMDKTLRFFQCDGVRNPKVQSIFLPDLPILSASFTPDGREVIASGRRKYFYSTDLVSGKVTKTPYIRGRDEKSLEQHYVSPDQRYIVFTGRSGSIILVGARTKQWIATLKMNGSVRSCTFSSDGSRMLSVGSDGQVYLWDLGTRRCIARHDDLGRMSCGVIAASRDDRYYATGAGNGMVNVYEGDGILTGIGYNDIDTTPPEPLKTVKNLTTAVNCIDFNVDSQLMAISSRANKDALKLVHLPSCTTYSNWPTLKTPLHFVSSLSFSPNGGYLAVGNDRGRVLLYRVNHYSTS